MINNKNKKVNDSDVNYTHATLLKITVFILLCATAFLIIQGNKHTFNSALPILLGLLINYIIFTKKSAEKEFNLASSLHIGKYVVIASAVLLSICIMVLFLQAKSHQPIEALPYYDLYQISVRLSIITPILTLYYSVMIRMGYTLKNKK